VGGARPLAGLRRMLRPPALQAVALAALVAAAYAASLEAPFVFDDVPSVVQNVYLESLWPGRALRSPDHVESSFAGRPLASYSLAVSYALSGREVWGFHALNVLLHATNACLLLGVLRRSFASGGERLAGAAPGLALAAAALWAVHPLASEAVVYVSARSELLVSACMLAVLYAACRAFAGGGGARLWTGVAVAAGLLAPLCKENAVSLPVAVLLYDRSFVSGGFGRALRRHTALHAGLAASWLPLAALVAGAPRGKTVGFGLGLGPLESLYTQAGVLLHYLRLAVCPHPLQFLYDWTPVRSLPAAMPELAVVTGLFAVTLWGVVRRPAPAFPAACFFVLLAPTSSVVPIVSELAAEKRMYLPLAGLVAGGVAGAWALLCAAARRARARPSARDALLAAAAVLAALTLALASADRVRDYRSERALWSDTLAKAPNHPWAHNNLGLVYRQEGDLDRAEHHFREALARRPGLAPAWVNLGNLRMARGDPAGAAEAYREALARLPDAAEAHYNLGLALARLGRLEEALPRFEEAVRIYPQHRFAQLALARTYERLGLTERARHHAALAAALDR